MITTDPRLSGLAAELDAGLIARREFLRKSAVLTGGTAAGLAVLRGMASAQPKTKLRIWLFKSYVTGGNDILAKHVEAWAKERNVEPEFDWATFGDREQKFVAAIEAGNPPDVAEMNYQGPMRYKAALRDETKLAKDLAAARGGLLPYADRVMQFNGQYYGIARLAFGGGLHVRKDLLAEKGLKMPKVYDPDVIDVAKKCQDPSKDIWGFGQTLNRCDDGNGFMQNILWNYGGSAWDKDGKPALATSNLKAEHGGAAVRGRHDPEAQGPAARRHGLERREQQRGVHGGQARHHQQRRQPVLRDGGQEAPAVRENPGHPHAGRAGRHVRLRRRLQLGRVPEVEVPRAGRGHDPLGRGREAVRGVHEGVQRPGRPVYKSRAEHPYWKSDPNYEGMLQNIMRSMWPGYPGPITPAAIEVQAQYMLCDMAGRVVSAGSRSRRALKETHGRIEEVYKIRGGK